MIKIDFTLAVGLFISVPLVLVFGIWIFYNFNRKEGIDVPAEYLQQCPYCTLIFFNNRAQAIRICPRCHSLVDQPAKRQ